MEDLQEHAERLFVTLLGLEPSKREAYLDEVCFDSPAVRVRVEELLKEDEAAGSFLNRPLLALSLTPPFPQFNNASSGERSCDPATSHLPQFHPGDLIANRFLVSRFIAKGGMGEVYEVEDRQLRGIHVALKTILSHFALDPLIHERFKREVLMAREVSHPNVCPIYDIFEWKQPHGPLTFLTMKFLNGETLAARLSRGGALPPGETLLIAHQVAAGLSATQSAGILHRDIKPANILLCGAEDRLHAYVTDFGLARPFIAETTALTAGLAGTPGYVAPELYHGAPPSKASDVYSLGIVIYQMLTGQSPGSILIGPRGGSLDALTSAIPPQWKKVIEKSLQLAVEARFQDISELARALPAITQATKTGIPVQLAFSRRKLIAVGATSLAAMSGGLWLGWNEVLDLFDPLPQRRSVALMAWPLGNLEPLVTTVLDSIRVRLSRAETYVKDFLVLGMKDALADNPVIDSPEKFERFLGANLVLAASLRQDSSRTHLQLRLLEPETLRVLRKREVSCLTAEISRLSERAALAAAEILHVPQQEINLNDPEELRNVPHDVFEIFCEAEQLMREPNRSGLKQAIVKYQHAIELDRHFSLAYAKLSIAYVQQFIATHEPANIDLARGNASLAIRYNPNSAMGLLGQALTLLYSGKTPEALQYFAKALKADPGNPEILLYKAQALQNQEQLSAAAQVYRDILIERPNYWPAYNNLGAVLVRDAKYQEAAETFSKAAMAAPSVALPMANLGATYLQLGKRDDARNALTESLRRAPNVDAYLALGDIDFEDGRYDAARRAYESAGTIEPKYHLIQRNIGDCYAMAGNAQKVKESYSRAADLLSKLLEVNPQNGNDWATLAFYHAKIGKLEEAESDIGKADRLGAKDVSSRFMVTQALVLMGKKNEALVLLLWCLKQNEGISPADVDLALDLRDLRKDPEYISYVKNSSGTKH